MIHLSIFRVAALVLLSGTTIAQTQPIDTAHSVITVRVLKSGLFSAFGDNHEIRAPISSGFLDQAGNRVELVVDSRKLVVLDPNLAVEKRQQVQERSLLGSWNAVAAWEQAANFFARYPFQRTLSR